MSRTRIKICGITRPQDAQSAAELGADAIGMNFLAGPRCLSLPKSFDIVRGLSPLLTIVALTTSRPALFPSALTPLQISQFQPRLPIHTYQMYGGENVEFAVPAFYSSYWAVVPVNDRGAIRNLTASVLAEWHDPPAAILLDTASPEKLGGTGQTFDWHWIAEARAAGELDGLPPIILAGGLNPDNVANAIRIARPYAVDVASGVEIPNQPGIKDPLKIRDFIQAVRSTDT